MTDPHDDAHAALPGSPPADADAVDPSQLTGPRSGPTDDLAGDVDVRPLGESPFAVEHGLVGITPDVAVSGPAVRQARERAGWSTVDLAEELAARGESVHPDELTRLEDRPATRVAPRRARLLAALVDAPPDQVEARAEPWSTATDAVAALAVAGADAVVLGDDVVVPTAGGGYLGVLHCPGDAAVLDTRTYRWAAARLLNGDWAHLAGALLVCAELPLRAVAVDALDCVSRSHAPSGLLGFSRLAEPEPVGEAVATYDRSYATNWSDPEPLGDAVAGVVGSTGPTPDDVYAASPGSPPADADGRMMARLADLTDRLGDEARRSRQAGKRAGYERAAAALRSLGPGELVGQLSLFAAEPVDTARARLAELLDHDETPDAGGGS